LLDVAAIGHALCENSKLSLPKRIRAMNEGFSDIEGACVEYFAAPEKSTWLIGRCIERRAGSAALRSAVIPSQKDNLIPTVTYWKALIVVPYSG
jgi:Zn-dependent metalloprotease